MKDIEYSAEHNLQDTILGDTVDSFAVTVSGVQIDDAKMSIRQKQSMNAISLPVSISGQKVTVEPIDTNNLSVGDWVYFLTFCVGGRVRTYLHGNLRIVRGGRGC